MTQTETKAVTLEIDGRPVTVPAGTPLVLAAAVAGVEIPTFCYEPRLGLPIGACRMCLVEVEMNGRAMPKLQAACTMTASDGMIVRSASERARTGQDAVLEFILLNHPLDCPVCDKGGECPLQDLTYRYGPANTRNRLPKRTYEKPLPISPSILLDRDRCIFCYRCTRFSSDIAEDGELIARDRGAEVIIATFEEKAYENVFSGNVTELCPVGALLTTPYRFRARPWEIVNVPTVCQGCSVGCNTWITLREGNAERVLSRNQPDLDDGWLCDRGRFARHEPRSDRLLRPVVRGEYGLDEVDLETASASVARRLRHLVSLYGPGSIALLSSGDLTNEEAFGWSLVADEVGARTASAPVAAQADWDRVDPYSARVADLDAADLIVVVGDAEVSDRAGVVDLRIRKGRRAGAHLAIVGAGGTALERDAGEVLQTNAHAATAIIAGLAQAARDSAAEGVRARPDAAEAPREALRRTAEFAAAAGMNEDALADLGRRLAEATRPVLVVTDGVSSSWLENLGWTLGLDRKPGAGILPLPRGANERGARAAGLTGGADEVLPLVESGQVRAIVMIGVDPTEEWPEGARWRDAIGAAEYVVTSAAFPNTVVSWSHVAVPANIDHEREGTTTNLEGRVQRLRQAVEPAGGASDLAFVSQVATGLGLAMPKAPAKAFRLLVESRPAFAGLEWKQLAGQAAVPVRPEAPASAPWPSLIADPGSASRHSDSELFHLIAPRPLMSGAAVERTAALVHQRSAWVQLARDDAHRLGLVEGDLASVEHSTGRHTGAVRISRRQRPGTVRINWRGPITGSGARVRVELTAGASG